MGRVSALVDWTSFNGMWSTMNTLGMGGHNVLVHQCITLTSCLQQKLVSCVFQSCSHLHSLCVRSRVACSTVAVYVGYSLTFHRVPSSGKDFNFPSTVLYLTNSFTLG